MSSLQQYRNTREAARMRRIEARTNRVVGFLAVAVFIALLAFTYIMHLKTVADDKAAANYTTERGN
jgi:hypothetical protein